MEGVEYEAEVYKVRGELPRWEQTKMKKAQDVIKKSITEQRKEQVAF